MDGSVASAPGYEEFYSNVSDEENHKNSKQTQEEIGNVMKWNQQAIICLL